MMIRYLKGKYCENKNNAYILHDVLSHINKSVTAHNKKISLKAVP
jgi:hypothetical protein